ncbi:LLM class flavin-dependent oxidoreductase [Micromonospora echinaurantiaca]|uniref:LLM class flavin-dependent oxidoreductase n=1 Tax=Micromonospora echinaurantiaca TaxID=47857 RepID=UPI0034370E61
MTDYGHELTFGTFITPQNENPQVPVQLAQLTEAAGLDLATFQDHPYQPGFLDTWTLLTWVAAATERISVAGNVLNLALRPPAVLARSAASLDRLSAGRFTLGLGAGAFWEAIEAMGGRRLTPGQGVQALAEGIEIIRGIWDTADPTTLTVDGTYHRVAGVKRGPAPAHDIPIWLGALKPRMLRLTGRVADGWAVTLQYVGDDGLVEGNATIDEAATRAGRHPAEIRRVLNIGGAFTPHGRGFLQGPPAQWVEQLAPYALERGIGTFILIGDDPRAIQTFGQEVAPALRELVAAERAAAGTAPVARRRGSAALAARRAGIAYDDVPAALAAGAVEPGDREYASVRSGYLRAGRPGLVLRPRSAEEVAEALAYARKQEVPIAVRSGGHGISGRSTNDGGIVVDLGALDGIELLDERTGLVRLGAGARWGQVAEQLVPHGLAISSGDYGGVGVGGLATTGGIGFMGRLHGLTIDHVRAAEVVLADGRIVRADAEHHPDLFWALRGAGANVGAVTALELAADRVGDIVHSVMLLDASDTAGVLARWGQVVETSPRELTSFIILSPNRGAPSVVARVMTVYASDDTDAAVAALQRLADIAPVLDHEARLTPYSGVVFPTQPHHATGGLGPITRSGLFTHLTPEVSGGLARLVTEGVSYFLQLRAVGGAVNDVPAGETAYPHRHQNFSAVAFGGGVRRAALDDPWDSWVYPHAEGLYLSFETDPRPERLRDAFPEPTLSRLRQVKRAYDPDAVFNTNFPVPPATD